MTRTAKYNSLVIHPLWSDGLLWRGRLDKRRHENHASQHNAEHDTGESSPNRESNGSGTLPIFPLVGDNVSEGEVPLQQDERDERDATNDFDGSFSVKTREEPEEEEREDAAGHENAAKRQDDQELKTFSAKRAVGDTTSAEESRTVSWRKKPPKRKKVAKARYSRWAQLGDRLHLFNIAVAVDGSRDCWSSYFSRLVGADNFRAESRNVGSWCSTRHYFLFLLSLLNTREDFRKYSR